jgi:hypothetical protein
MTKEMQLELKRLLEIERERVLSRDNTDLAIKLAYILIGLNGYISGSINIQKSIQENVDVGPGYVSASVQRFSNIDK